MIEPLRILVIDDNIEDRTTYHRLLARESEAFYTVIEAETADEAIAKINQSLPDCILLDYRLPDMDGLELLTELSNKYHDQVPAIVMLTGEGSDKVAVKAMKDGAQDYLVKTEITGDGLRQAIDRAIEKTGLKRLYKLREGVLKRLSVRDDLTGLYGYRYALEHLQEEIYRAQRYATPFSVAMLDLDQFEQIVADYGELVADTVLKDVGRIFKESARVLDIVSRYDNSQFLIILPHTTLSQGTIVLERLQAKIRSTKFYGLDESLFQVTCTIGQTEYAESVNNADIAIERVENALCRAKSLGGDQLCIWSEEFFDRQSQLPSSVP